MQYSSKTSILLTLVAVMHNRTNDRNLKLSEFTARCISTGAVHELIFAHEWDGDRKKTFNKVSYIGFALFQQGGVIEIGDKILSDKNQFIGEVVGFDSTHMPNHMNIILASSSNLSGTELGLYASQVCTIEGY